MSWEHVIPEFILRMKGLCRDYPESIIKFPIWDETRAFIYIDDFIDGLLMVLYKGGIWRLITLEPGGGDYLTVGSWRWGASLTKILKLFP